MKSTEDSVLTAEERARLFKNVITLFKMNGIAINPKTMDYMKPLLDGDASLEEHQEMLELLIREAERG